MIFYLLWLCVPVALFTISLWTYTETVSNKEKKNHEWLDFFRQGVFTLICVGISIILDIFALPIIIETLADFVPEQMLRTLLFPIVLYLGAVSYGPSKVIRVDKITTPSQRNATKKR